MSAFPVPWPTATATVRGAPPSTPIRLGDAPASIKLLAVVAHGDGAIDGLDPAAFDVVDGSLVSELDTSGKHLVVVYAT